MLRHLQIRDFAIIDTLEIDFALGMSVLTGETGAGKSILVDALELLAGGRAGSEVVRAGSERADVTASFDAGAASDALRALLEQQSVDAGPELLLRRVVGSDGRSRCWLNGQSVPVTMLRQVAEQLIDIHGQHEFQSLLRPATQRQLIDSFGQHHPLADQVQQACAAWQELAGRAQALDARARDQDARLDLLRYQVGELDALQLRDGEVAELAAERTRVSHRGRLAEAARGALDALYESDAGNAYALLARAQGGLRAVASLDRQLDALAAPLDEAAIHVKEAAQTLGHYLDTLDIDAATIDAVEKRLAAIEELSRKHRVAPAELNERHSALRGELAAVENSAMDLATVRAQQAAALAEYRARAQRLSAARIAAARGLAREVTAHMQELGMAGGRFFASVEPQPDSEPTPHGTDRVSFLVSTNPGQPPRPLAKVASGGELARLSLAVQVACARDSAPCMVFDEVDAGIGGGVAEIVGRELRALGTGRQVLCVTHLPQVASQGHQHLRVSKLSDGRSTRTQIAALSGDARVAELARMLGGVEVTARARAHAVEMLERSSADARDADSPPAGTRRKAPGRAP